MATSGPLRAADDSDTVTDSLRAGASASSRRTVAAAASVTGRTVSAKPVAVKVTRYAPGGRSATRYSPVLPVTARRTPWSAGDDTDTVTPPSGAPPETLTAPLSVASGSPWPAAGAASAASAMAASPVLTGGP